MLLRILTVSAFALMAAPGSAQVAADPVMGAKQFGQCRVCHNIEANKPDGVGPNLFGIYNAKAASRRPKYAYSPALKASKLAWNDATLDRWITDPGATVKGTKMEFIGMARKPVRANIIAYLKTLK